MKYTDNEDVLIVGAGAVGSSLGYALAIRGLKVTVIDADTDRPPPVGIRTSAITHHSSQWLESLGLWPAEDLARAPLRALHITDHTGQGHLYFDSADLGTETLGVIVAHDALETSLRNRAQRLATITWYTKAARAVSINDQGAQVVLDSGEILKGRLLIAADGAKSHIREQLGVPGWSRDYGQRAIVATVNLAKPHQETAWQRFLDTGPLALLPLTDPHCASLVWSIATTRAQDLLNLRDPAFNAALQSAFGNDLGELSVASQRLSFPLTVTHAHHYVGHRFALVGDAAHRVHPLAGQGVNLGFGDAEILVKTLVAARQSNQDIGNRLVLRRYERYRKLHNVSMLLATDSLNSLFHTNSSIIRQLLATGLNITDTLKPLKTFFMRQAGA